MKPIVDKDGKELIDPLNPERYAKTEQFLEFYQKRLETIDKELEEYTEKHDELKKLISKKEMEYGKFGHNYDDKVHEILVVVYSKKSTSIALQVAYIIQSGTARWTASYDARVSSGEQSLELNYYGNIFNNSGEDWNNINLALSTAQPSVAGKPPELTTKYVTIKPKYQRSYGDEQIQMNFAVQKAVFNSVVDDDIFFEQARAPQYESASAPKPSEGLTTTTFIIPRKSTITADNKVHKVMIRTLPFDADFTYTVIPKLSLNAYLKASIKNSTKNFPLLPGPMNVFMDNNFVAKSDIPLLNPNESLGVFLGVDASLKIDYLPVSQFKDTQGLISKTNKLNIRYMITITNNKNKEVKLEVFDNLPKSNDSTIKVKLIEPDISAEHSNRTTTTPSKSVNPTEWGGASITPANNLHWKISIPAGAKKEIPFAYSIDYPIDIELTNAY